MYTRTGRRITFSYGNNDMVRLFLEKGNDMLPLYPSSETVSLDERSKMFPFVDEPDEVTTGMLSTIFKSAYSRIMNAIADIAPRDYNGTCNITSTGTSVVIEDDYGYKESDIEALDALMYDILIYGALHEWFSMSGNATLSEPLSGKVADRMKSLSDIVKRMFFILKRKPLRNPFSISTDIVPEGFEE